MRTKPTIHPDFAMEARVKMKENFGLENLSGRTGTIIGMGSDHIFNIYIVLLDGPPHQRDDQAMRAVAMPGQCLEEV